MDSLVAPARPLHSRTAPITGCHCPAYTADLVNLTVTDVVTGATGSAQFGFYCYVMAP
ncbi:hypothetical protein [Kitasatospora azatica]|uniref:hypothetical protein n=1 Tax=Kitasatospora azatica TaxID=58347 RepID=UPI0012F93DF2|nr:hypothetical protein [Kitasatospora azatica]